MPANDTNEVWLFGEKDSAAIVWDPDREKELGLTPGAMKLEVHPDRRSAGSAAARAAADAMQCLVQNSPAFGMVFATGASQLDLLPELTSIPGLPWDRVHGFHLDEYAGLDENHPASFRRYLRRNLTSRVSMGEFSEIDGNTADIEAFCAEYAAKLAQAAPQIGLLGIGENGHLAFNDPDEADFDDPKPMKIVTLDTHCRRQQVGEGWFSTLEEVPRQALTLTIPTIFRIPKLIVTVPDRRKAEAVRATLRDPISPACPSTLLRRHPDVTLYLDVDSASLLGEDDLLHAQRRATEA
jgi:glucosamine-6-phosphate deaminase